MKMKNILFLLVSVLIIVVSYSNNPVEEHSKLVRIDNNNFEFELPKDSKEIDGDLKNAMLQLNSNILYLAICDTNGSGNMFMVSKYVSENKESIEEAFMQSVNTASNFNIDTLSNDFHLIDYKVYKVKGKTLRYKISAHFGNVNTIMYYFMKDDYSNELYEIKAIARKNELPKVLNFMEEVALSVKIK